MANGESNSNANRVVNNEYDIDEEALRTHRKKCLVGSIGLFAVGGGGTAILSAAGVSVNTMLTIATILLTGILGAILITAIFACYCATLAPKSPSPSSL
ncbi:MAG: hypothetical protein K0R24_1029 [Gammaproteobacteria bacterium]|nr:hypothetical protein [Gammaproteobacteria bacterium]